MINWHRIVWMSTTVLKSDSYDWEHQRSRALVNQIYSCFRVRSACIAALCSLAWAKITSISDDDELAV